MAWTAATANFLAAQTSAVISAMILVPNQLEAFLNFDDIVALNDEITAKADAILLGATSEIDRAQALFEWVRDEIPHTKDLGEEIVTCSSVEAFSGGTGICFAKSHLLAAMMRHAGVPCGFCYQVFENPLGPQNGSLALHGLNAIFLKKTGRWHRIDPRGNRDDIKAEFSLDAEILAFPEMKFMDSCIYAQPLTRVIDGLRRAESIQKLWPVLPSVAASD